MLFSFSGDQRQQQQGADDDDGRNQQEGRFETRRQERQDRVDPEEREIGFRRGLDDGGIGLSGGTERAEEESTGDDGEHDGRRKDRVLPYGVRHKGHAVLLDQLVIFALVSGFPHQAARHRPLIDAETQHHPHMQADAREQDAGNHEDMQREEAG